jgi:hypothetical protein
MCLRNEGKVDVQWNGIKIPIVILSLAVGLVALWGGQWLYGRYNYDRPLARVLGENKDVVSYNINDRNAEVELEVKLGMVDNLQNSYSSLYESVKSVLGRRNFKLVVRDNRDSTLEAIYYYTRLAAYESLERGNFLQMEDYIAQRAAGQGAVARIFIDADRLYIQIKHDDHYLYEIIPRSGPALAVPAQS